MSRLPCVTAFTAPRLPHLRAAATHDQAADLHEAAANLQEEHAAEMGEAGTAGRFRAERAR